MYTLEDIAKVDPEVARLIEAEFERQNSHLELIASENWASKAVMSAMGSVLTNKYAEAAITAAASASMRSRRSRLRERRSCSAAPTPTFSRTPAHRPIWLFSTRCLSRAIPTWA